jgi:hypothetical protein
LVRGLQIAANAVTDSNNNPMAIPLSTNVTVSGVSLTIAGKASHKMFLIGHFGADFTGAKGVVVAEVTEDLTGTAANKLQITDTVVFETVEHEPGRETILFYRR